MALIASVLTGCNTIKMHFKADYACTTEGNDGKSCSVWTQTGLMAGGDLPIEEETAFKDAIGSTCLKYSDKGYCTSWKQAGSSKTDGSSGCFPGSTLVLTRSGPMPMSKVSIGDELLGMDHASGTVAFSKVRAWLHREVDTEMEMTILTTSAGRVVASPKHSIATDHGHYVFAQDINIGETLLASDGTRLVVLEKSQETARGLYSPFTVSSNFFAGESEHGMVLAHNFAHVWQPQLFAGTLHRIFDVAEWLWPHSHVLPEGDTRYAHPIVQRLAPLAGIYV